MSDESGRGDPGRTLELLWGTREPPSRGPKPGLTVDQIVRTAIALADAEGLEAVSMRRLAGELGAGTMSLYRYVPGKAELVDLMLDAVHGEGDPPGASGWRAELEHHARQTWAMHQRHPWAAGAYRRPVLGPNVIDRYEAMLRALDGTGLPPGDMVNAAELVAGYVDGAARQRSRGPRARRAVVGRARVLLGALLRRRALPDDQRDVGQPARSRRAPTRSSSASSACSTASRPV